MNQSKALIRTLKSLLRSRHITYADIARQLDVSEVTIKRLFSHQRLSLQRLEAICELLDITLLELLQYHARQTPHIAHLTVRQEQELVSDPRLLLVALCIKNHWSLEDILQQYILDKAECIRHLIHLESLGLIELLPNNRYRLLIDEHFQWLKNGPIEQFFEKEIQARFLGTRFSQEGRLRRFLYGDLSAASLQKIRQRLQALIQTFELCLEEDKMLPVTERQSVALLLAMRDWELESSQALKRNCSDNSPENNASSR
ncbi:MAG: XRE family transcriptional regulator [Gammaproteobacteria bacterium]|nr:MAG: XRE family transcriptional regulator [Gammaproteobacteria bacterium]